MPDDRSYFPEGTDHKEVYQSMGLLDFVWDAAKNKHNIEVHHISFETAMLVFNDMNRIEIYDESHSEDEDRYDTIGLATPPDLAESKNGVGMKLTLGKVHGIVCRLYGSHNPRQRTNSIDFGKISDKA